MIMINDWDGTAVRCESNGAKEIKEALRALVKKGVEVIWGTDAETMTEDRIDLAVDGAVAWGVDLSEAFGSVWVTEEEGNDGVAICYSSADRNSFAVSWPADEDDWLGNGDPMVYKTAGVAPGVVVKGEEWIDPAIPD